MFNEISNFQLVIGGIFAALAVAGLVAFATFSSSSKQVTEIDIWSDIDSDQLELWLKTVDDEFKVTYRYIPHDDFTQTLIENLSLGLSPDVLITNSNRQYELGQRLQHIPMQSLSLTDFRDQYVSGAESAFVAKEGYAGLPLFVDPIVLFSNRRLMDINGISNVPLYWDEVSQMTVQYARHSGRSIEQTLIPIGTYDSTVHAKDIISAMLSQVRKYLIQPTDQGYASDLSGPEVLSVMSYYVDFADPSSAVYNWSDNNVNSFETFLAEDSLMYVGKASDYIKIIKQNPNLDVRVSELPQIRDSLKSTIADFYGVYTTRSADLYKVFNYLDQIMSSELHDHVAKDIGMSPAKRAAIQVKSDDELVAISDRSALYSTTWPDIDPEKTNKVLKTMIDEVLYRSMDISSVILKAQNELQAI